MQTIKLSSSFLRDVFDLPKEIQKTTFDFIDKITLEHPAKIPSLNYEKMQNTTSGLSIYSARINDKYRVLIHQENNELHLLKIGNHEPTYDSVKKINIISIMNIDNLSISKKDSSDLGKLFARISSKELEKVGIKNDKDIKVIRQINTEKEYYKLKEEKILSDIVFDNLDLLLAEININELVSNYRTRYKKAMSILLENVIQPALNHSDLDCEIKMLVQNTKDRLLKKESLEEIIYFYNDALDSKSGKKIVEEFRKHHLNAFEDYKTDILKIARGW